MKVRISPRLEFQADAIGVINLKDFEDIDYVVKEILLDHPYLIFRGQRNSEWPLRASLDRLFSSSKDRLPKIKDATILLKKFKYSTRGSLSSEWAPKNDNSWWALGQHFGLATPLTSLLRSIPTAPRPSRRGDPAARQRRRAPLRWPTPGPRPRRPPPRRLERRRRPPGRPRPPLRRP